MKKLLLIALSICAIEISFAQTASDYYMPLCVSNQTVLHTDHNNLGWAGRTTTYTFIKTDLISGELYFVEAGIEYLFNEGGFPRPFRYFWLKKSVNGEILIKAFSEEYPILDSAVIFPVAGILFSNNYFTVGYSITHPTGPNQTMTDSVISTNATFGIFNNCIQIRTIVKSNGVITITGDIYYASGVGLVGGNRIFPPNQVHTAHFASTFVTGCDPIVDSLPPNIVDTCLGQYFDYYVNNIQVDTMNSTVTVTWVFQDGVITHQFIQTYNYQYQGNNVIGITIQCNGKKSSETYYKLINISSSQLGVNEPVELNSKIIIYPNPASDFITLNFDNANNTDLTLNIYNVIGTLVKYEILKQNNRQINIGDLKNGIYMVEIKSKEWSEKQKLIIQR
ncbi:MAG: T9SS type A sorting domain-containing protein [Bacteroidales bacterium]|nr:T9SS type A sorting domain-containing protein [Bacteroidales bacterium]